MRSTLSISPETARRLAVTRQRLADPMARPNANGMMSVARDLGCVQLDPLAVVARNHLLVFFSRLGPYDPALVDRMLYQERKLFEYWGHAASIVLTEDYPIHRHMMRTHSLGNPRWSEQTREWISTHDGLRRSILAQLRRAGPLPSRYFEEIGSRDTTWVTTGWAGGGNVSRMLDILWIGGKIMVAGRAGVQKLWDLSERVLPEWTPRQVLSETELVRRAAQRSLRALGVATPKQISQHFIRGRYPNLKRVLAELEAEGTVGRVDIAEDGHPWSGEWFIHAQDLPLLKRLEKGEWQPRTTLLSPFDNLICDRARARQLFDFDYNIEIYTPKHRRRYGYYVMPILHGDRLIGRIDPVMERKNSRLTIKAVHMEPGAPDARASGKAVAAAIQELGTFLGAKEIEYSGQVPAAWRRALR